MRQRRKHERFRVQQHVWCTDGEATFFARAADASLGGLFVRIPGVEVGRVVEVSFALLDGGAVVAEAEVVWSGPKARGRLGVGLAILGFSAGEATYARFVRAASGS